MELLTPGTTVLFIHKGDILYGDIVVAKHIISETAESFVYDIAYFDGDNCRADGVPAEDVSTTVRGLVDRIILMAQNYIRDDYDERDTKRKPIFDKWIEEIVYLRTRLNS